MSSPQMTRMFGFSVLAISISSGWYCSLRVVEGDDSARCHRFTAGGGALDGV